MICYKILTPKGNKYEIDYTEIHEAFRELDRARLGAGIRVGYRGGSDALGGSYFPGWYDGISGVHRLRNALDAIAEHAWEIIHQSSRRVNAVVALGMRDGWIVKYKHGATAVTLTDHYLRPRVFRTHRGAAIVAGRNRTRHGAAQVICGTTEEHARITKIHEEVRVAVRTLLAARRAYDALAITHSPYEHTISAGYASGRLHATGLHWLAGASTDSPVTVDQARAFADGASIADALGHKVT